MDKWLVIQDLAYSGQRRYDLVNELWTQCNGNYLQVYEYMFDYPGLKTAAKQSRSKIISGRSVFNTSINKKPINTFFKACQKRTSERDVLIETIKSFANDKLADDLINRIPAPPTISD